MADRGTTTLAPPAPTNGKSPAGPSRALTRRRTLPGSRAVVGGLLVTTAAVGLFAAYDSANSGPDASYVVATDEIEIGERFDASKLALVPMELPAAQRSVSFTDIGALSQAVATARIGEGQLIQSTLTANAIPDGKVHVSVGVDPANAMNGSKLTGRRVDVVMTNTDGGFPVATTVARRVRVVGVVTGDENLGNSGRLTVTLEVDRDDAEAVAMAGTAGNISLVRLES